MNRKKAILSIFLIGGAAGGGFAGYKWFSIHKTPDLGYLDAHQPLIADLAETIIPATDTPGAKEAMVHVTLTAMMKNVADRKTQNIFIDGLKDVEKHATGKFSASFSALTPAQQHEVVAYFSEQGKNYSGMIGRIKNKFIGKSFFHILKDYSTIAFCTSKMGATQTLAYNFIPGAYQPCMPMVPGQKSWATK